jgi:malonyl CoA-acyl carrier protein transacylase
MSESTLIHWFHRIDRKIDGLYALLEGRSREVMASFQDVQDAIQAQTSVEGGITTLLQSIAGQLRSQANSGGATPEQLQTLVDEINANTGVLSAAVVANTPAAAPAPTDAPAPTPPATP